MYLFYTPNIQSDNSLCEEESTHCVRVLRYTRGDTIILTDGKGTTFTAKITNPNPKHCEFEIISSQKQLKGHDFYLHIAIAPTKNIDRIEWMVEKCTEIGVDEITPLICRYSERKQVRMDRLEKIIQSAAKQSLTPYLPTLNPPTEFNDFIENAKEQDKFIAHCYNDDKKVLRDEIRPGNDVLILIGPEGDFSEEEILKALSLNFIPVSLGNSRLRTETAGVVACHTAILMNE